MEEVRRWGEEPDMAAADTWEADLLNLRQGNGRARVLRLCWWVRDKLGRSGDHYVGLYALDARPGDEALVVFKVDSGEDLTRVGQGEEVSARGELRPGAALVVSREDQEFWAAEPARAPAYWAARFGYGWVGPRYLLWLQVVTPVIAGMCAAAAVVAVTVGEQLTAVVFGLLAAIEGLNYLRLGAPAGRREPARVSPRAPAQRGGRPATAKEWLVAMVTPLLVAFWACVALVSAADGRLVVAAMSLVLGFAAGYQLAHFLQRQRSLRVG